MTTVVNFKTDPYDVYIGRDSRGKVTDKPFKTGYFGNPYKIGSFVPVLNGRRKIRLNLIEDVIDWYMDYFHKKLKEDKEFKKAILSLKGKTLGCWCKPKGCHGDVIAEWLNSPKV